MISLKKNNSGFVLLLSLILIIFLGLLLEASSLRTNIELTESLNRLATQQAFYAAESGLQQYVSRLGQNSSLRIPASGVGSMGYQPFYINNSIGTTEDNRIGYYKVAITPPGNILYKSYFPSVYVQSWGQDKSQKVTVSILAQVVVENPASYFLSTAGDIHLGSGTTINQSILGNNIYFDVNSALPAPQQSIAVTNNVFYLQSVNGNNNPAVSIGGATAQSPTQTFSGVDTSYYSNIAQNGGDYVDGDITFNGEISRANFGSVSAPNTNGVVYATGNIYISGAFKDNMLFVAGGNIYIEDNITPVSSGGTTPQIGLLAKSDLIIPSSAPNELTVQAFLMADGSGPNSLGGIIQAQAANPNPDGTITPKTSITINGAMALRGSGAISAANLNVYPSRSYSYNTQFQSNLQIPFLPSISKIVSWQEVNPNTSSPS